MKIFFFPSPPAGETKGIHQVSIIQTAKMKVVTHVNGCMGFQFHQLFYFIYIFYSFPFF